jgi:8-oxo-dGTP diphosphatase
VGDQEEELSGDESAPLECVAFMLVKDNRVLAEKRKLTKALVPGAVALPGGHMEGDEDPREALRRELLEELGVVASGAAYVSWEGEILNREAEALLWVSLDESHALDLAIDRVAVGEYIRVHQNPHD